MTLEEFKASLSEKAPPTGLSVALEALWIDANGDWNRAHRLVQESSESSAAWVHAYLHRKEGDRDNAAYWYRRAHKSSSGLSFTEEWDQIAGALLAGG
jgi:hypothetical protein